MYDYFSLFPFALSRPRKSIRQKKKRRRECWEWCTIYNCWLRHQQHPPCFCFFQEDSLEDKNKESEAVSNRSPSLAIIVGYFSGHRHIFPRQRASILWHKEKISAFLLPLYWHNHLSFFLDTTFIRNLDTTFRHNFPTCLIRRCWKNLMLVKWSVGENNWN